MDILRVNGIQVYAYHGCIPEEAQVGGYFTINAAFWGDFRQAVQSDDLSNAIDYVSVAKVVNEQMAIRAKLIETVAYNMVDALKAQFAMAQEVEVTIIKHRAPIEMPVEEVSFTVRA